MKETVVYGNIDPIAAVATASGESALAVVRTSGGSAHSGDGVLSAVELVSKVFSRPRKLLEAPGNSVVHGWIVDESEKIDDVLISVYRCPHSYTGEDGADISCHGGRAAVKAIMAALKKAGFRDALPGEFTFRAFMNGKLDLTRAESVMELVAAKTGKGREQAVRRLSGVLEKEISTIKELLVEILADAEIYLDYSEDEFDKSSNQLNAEAEGKLPDRTLVEKALLRLKMLAELWKRERIYAEGALAVIAGRPNAGKSSLFNYLLREDRSIVTDIPGTTRDWIEAQISVEDIPLRLADTAGLRDEDAEADEAERIGIERSLGLLDKADIILYLIDGKEGIARIDREFIAGKREKGKPVFLIRSKSDIASPQSGEKELLPDFFAVSAKTGTGVSSLMKAVAAFLEKASAGSNARSKSDAAGPGSERQKELIDNCIASLEEVLLLAGKAEPLDIIAPQLRSAVNALGEITGEVSAGDVLETMFSRFCVGK